jgi:predicted nucleotidyltransferase
MKTGVKYPTVVHKKAADLIVGFFSRLSDVEAVVLVGSCARGRATLDSCLDIVILVSPEKISIKKDILEQRWNDFYETENVFRTLQEVGKYSHVDLDIVDGCFSPKLRGWTSGPDEFELEIGNILVYSQPLWERSDYFTCLQSKWLPYYDDALRKERLTTVRNYCVNNLDHIAPYANRGLHFQAFDRLCNAFQEFLQALFISRRTYPIAYDKWIREQVEEILGMPELYRKLPRLFEIKHFESKEICEKAEDLRSLLQKYVIE